MFQRLSPLFPYLRRYWRQFAWGGLALLVYNCAKATIPLLVGTAVDDMRRDIHAAAVWQHALELIGIAILSAICLYLTRQIIIGASREIEFDLRNDLFAHLEKQPPSFFQRHRTGDIMARSTNDLSAVRQLLGPAIMYSANTVVFTAAALPFMLRMSPRLTLYAFLPLPFASVLVQYFGARIHTRFERIQAMFSDISAQAEENFSGARLIRAFAQEEAQIAAFEASNREYIRRSLLLDDGAGGGRENGTDCARAEQCRVLCSGGSLPAAEHAADDGDTGAGGGGGTDCGVLTQARARDAGGGLAGGGDGVLPGGGAQAVAAMAFGTETIGRVEKIVGPGNLYVTAAKTAVMHECGIDMPAGPTEIGVMSADGDARGIAADLVAQAEHDPEALAVLITPDDKLAAAVLAEVKRQAADNNHANEALSASGAIFVTKTVAEARELTNRLAFEHLSVDALSDLEWVRDAGSVFVGRFRRNRWVTM